MKRPVSIKRALLLTAAALSAAASLRGQSNDTGLTAESMRRFEFRSLGPSLTTGRISDIAVDPRNPSVWYVAAASGNLWKTENRGNTWNAIFDDHGSYSLGAVTVDPRDSNVVWLGTGENNNQRSVGFGDGVYKSIDGGSTWKRMGLEASEHIQNIVIDPRNSNVVYVTAIGPLWSPGGDRGLYKTTDGGQTWKAVLTISPDTGVTDVVMDPKAPDVLYAAAYQRRRAVGQLIGGGPESGLFKSTNGGQTWTKLTRGLPTVELGRIGLAISWRNPKTISALVTAQLGHGGFFRSDDAGASWRRVGRFPGGSGRGGRGGAPATPPQACGPVDPGAGSTTRTDTPRASFDPAPQAGPAADIQPPGGRGGAADDCYRGGDPGYYTEIYVDPRDPETIWS
ncbi:MAG: WD40/YVTN/BNR-like repeat-containing protein, partial [Vicinamibacterales bacterium]